MTITTEGLGTPVAQQQFDEPWAPSPTRYEAGGAVYRRCGRSGLDLPAISLGLWQNFGDSTPHLTQREILRTAFDLGITQFDLANNYGIPYGSAESNFGRHFARDFARHRDEIVVTTKAGWDMWPGPYGQGGGGRKYVLASLDQSLQRMGLDHVDIFYSHRWDPSTPIEETILALDQAVRSGKAIYAGISSTYGVEQTREAVRIAREVRLPLVVHQPRYSMLARQIEDGLMDVCGELGLGLAVFSPLAQGLLTNRYLGDEIPEGSRMRQQRYLRPDTLTDERIEHLRALNRLAGERGQSLAQMALAWLLRDERVTTVLVGASSAAQLRDSVAALANVEFTADELAVIDEHSRAAALD